MADISPEFANVIMNRLATDTTASARRTDEVADVANNLLAVGAARRQNEKDVDEARAQQTLLTSPQGPAVP
ncbi:MAG: hypothetical protein AAF532_16075 [Planctomycetota bacterium]